MKTKLAVFLLLSIIFTQAQTECSIEKSTFGIQIGFLGIWVHNEFKISNQIALRSEFGLDSGILGGSLYPKNGFLMTPIITLEPKWYYNLCKRTENSKMIRNNSGNFTSIKLNYNPDWFIISNINNINIVNQFSIIPT